MKVTTVHELIQRYKGYEAQYEQTKNMLLKTSRYDNPEVIKKMVNTLAQFEKDYNDFLSTTVKVDQ